MRNNMKSILLALLAACLSLTAVAGSGKSARPAPNPQFLFAQTAGAGNFDGHVLKLKNLSRTTLYFSDRPQRLAGHVVTADFFKHWSDGQDSFAKVPPNAVVSVLKDG